MRFWRDDMLTELFEYMAFVFLGEMMCLLNFFGDDFAFLGQDDLLNVSHSIVEFGGNELLTDFLGR